MGGAKGLKTFKNYQTKLGTWALLGQSFSYGDIIETGLASIQYPAILDTGNSELSVPPDIFEGLSKKWQEDLPNLVCQDNLTFCHIAESCEAIVDRLQPVGFQMSDYIFEITPEEYLFPARKNKCFFVIHRNELTGDYQDYIYMGDTFL